MKHTWAALALAMTGLGAHAIEYKSVVAAEAGVLGGPGRLGDRSAGEELLGPGDPIGGQSE